MNVSSLALCQRRRESSFAILTFLLLSQHLDQSLVRWPTRSTCRRRTLEVLAKVDIDERDIDILSNRHFYH
jgi:hypothetical protein